MIRLVCSALLGAMVFWAGAIHANNTSGVFTPDVQQGSADFEYRLSIVPDERGDAVAHRLHFQQALNGSWRYRLIGLVADDGESGYEFSFARFEVQWQFLENETAGWDSALRFEFQIANPDDPPSRARVGWTGKWDLGSEWQFRLNALTGHEFGPDSDDGFLLGGRLQLTRSIAKGWRAGVELFSDLNNRDAIGAFNDQEHQIGPVIKWRSGDWNVLGSVLFGVSEETDDVDIRLHVIRSF